MKAQLKIIGTALLAAGVYGNLEHFACEGGYEFQVRCNTIDEVFRAEVVASEIKARLGLDLTVAF